MRGHRKTRPGFIQGYCCCMRHRLPESSGVVKQGLKGGVKGGLKGIFIESVFSTIRTTDLVVSMASLNLNLSLILYLG